MRERNSASFGGPFVAGAALSLEGVAFSLSGADIGFVFPVGSTGTCCSSSRCCSAATCTGSTYREEHAPAIICALRRKKRKGGGVQCATVRQGGGVQLKPTGGGRACMRWRIDVAASLPRELSTAGVCSLLAAVWPHQGRYCRFACKSQRLCSRLRIGADDGSSEPSPSADDGSAERQQACNAKAHIGAAVPCRRNPAGLRCRQCHRRGRLPRTAERDC